MTLFKLGPRFSDFVHCIPMITNIKRCQETVFFLHLAWRMRQKFLRHKAAGTMCRCCKILFAGFSPQPMNICIEN